ncbi:MAG: hypothetical protein ACFFAU_01080 [Candidatus Hodarchaeota archaeon]
MDKEIVQKLWKQYTADIEEIRSKLYNDAVKEVIIVKSEYLRMMNKMTAIYCFFLTQYQKYDAAVKNNKTALLLAKKNEYEAKDEKFVKGIAEVEVDLKIKPLRLKRNYAEAGYKSAEQLINTLKKNIDAFQDEKNKF